MGGSTPSPFSNAFDAPQFGSLRYNTSQAGSPQPLVYGTARVSCNLLEFWGFSGPSHPSGSKGGKGLGAAGGKKGGGNYSVYVAFALCTGPVSLSGASHGIDGNNRIFSNGGIAAGIGNVGLSFYAGNDGQAADPVFASRDPNQPVIGYSGTAYVTGAPMQLGSSPVLPDIQFEVTGFLAGTAGTTYLDDANPSQIIVDFLTNPRYGAGFPAAHLDTAGSIADFAVYCQAALLGLSVVMDRSQSASRWLDEIARLSNAAVVWTGTLLKIIPYGDQALDQNGASWNPDLSWAASLTDDDFLPFEHISDGRPVENATDPVQCDFSDPQTIHNWMPVEYDDSANSYNPQIAPVFDQGLIDAFGLKLKASLVAHHFTNPVSAGISGFLLLQRETQIRTRLKFKLGWQHCLLEPMDIVLITDAGAGFQEQPFRITGYAEDDNGDLTFSAEEIPGVSAGAAVSPYGAGNAARHTRSNSAGAAPGYLVGPGGTNLPVIFEPPSGLTNGDYEVWMIASGGLNLVTTNAATVSGAVLHFAGVPASVVPGVAVADKTTPSVIPAGTTVLSTTATTVTVSANVSGAGVASGDQIAFYSPNWGGCEVWISTDNNTYALAGTIFRGGRQGVLTAALPAGGDPDTADTVSVDMAMSGGQLLSGTRADADNAITLCYCDGELISYETATLTAPYQYNLTYLRRGLYGTPIAAHGAGTSFARFGLNDPSLFKYVYPASLVGQTIYVKLQSFNSFGQELADLSAIVPTQYVLTGNGAAPPPMTISGSFAGSPTGNQTIFRYVFSGAVAFPAGLAGSAGNAGTAASGTATFQIDKNGAGVGTMIFGPGATAASFTMGAATTFQAGDVLTIAAPSPADATLANLAWSLAGTG
ncbi:MAG TPA: phage tail protein [Stellaceae bacterium]|nr:phage tail protein [Stellaceae bacterium]